MTDISFEPQTPSNTDDLFEGRPASVTDTYWGYIIRDRHVVGAASIIAHTATFIGGAGFAAAAIGLWLVPSALVQSDTFLMRAGLSVIFTVLAVLLISYARGGRRVEWHIDQGLGEVRKVASARNGKGVLLAQVGFDAISHFQIEKTDTPNIDRLVIVFNDEPTASIAVGNSALLAGFVARLAADFKGPRPERGYDAVKPIWG